jgi:hypothetical protein
MNEVAKRLREDTDYPWQDCIEAARRGVSYDMARELLTVIYRERKGIVWRGETTR